MAGNVCGKFVSKKINKIRWKPVPERSVTGSDIFLTGSWDEKNNELALWQYPPKDNDDGEPALVGTCCHDGDVTELQFLNTGAVVASSSFGSVSLLSVSENQLLVKSTWNELHHLKTCHCSCTSLASYDEDIATVGEDGRIVLLNAKNKAPVREMDEADSSSLLSVCFLKHNEIITANLRGQLKVWDLRSQEKTPSSTFMFSGEQIAVTCITHHPTQRHIVMAGSEDGGLSVWDLRQGKFPVTLLSAHSGPVSEVKFHPMQPEHLFTSSHKGELWHWNTTSMTRAPPPTLSTSISGRKTPDFSSDQNPWLSSEAAKHRLEVFSLLSPLHQPINSLDVDRSNLICGCDNEAVYVLTDLKL